MSLYEALSLSLQIVGYCLILLSIGIVTFQVILTKRTIETAANSSVGLRQINVDKIFVEKPHIYKYFQLGVEVNSSDADYEEARAVAQLLANYFDTYFLQRIHLKQLYTETSWKSYMSDYFASSPILCQHIFEYKDWYTKDLIKLMQSKSKIRNIKLASETKPVQ